MSASPEQADALLKDARTLWEQRDQLQKMLDLLALLSNSEETISQGSPQTKAQLRLLSARALVRTGGTYVEEKDDKLVMFEKAMEQAQASTAAIDSADAKYFYAAALGRWAETKGVMASLGKKDELMRTLNETKTRTSLDGNAGEAYEGQGADRVLGKIYAKLPSFVGGSRTKALELLNKAYAQAPQFAMNAIYLGEVLVAGDDEEKARGCEVLSQLLEKDASTLMPERVIETREELVQAQQIKANSCN